MYLCRDLEARGKDLKLQRQQETEEANKQKACKSYIGVLMVVFVLDCVGLSWLLPES